jgi:hypothetical protein
MPRLDTPNTLVLSLNRGLVGNPTQHTPNSVRANSPHESNPSLGLSQFPRMSARVNPFPTPKISHIRGQTSKSQALYAKSTVNQLYKV